MPRPRNVSVSPGCVPGGISISPSPSGVGTPTLSPSASCGKLTATSV
jgi:hypothetical protein